MKNVNAYKQLRHPNFIENETLDGVPVVDIQAAIQAAWLADPAFAVELAKRYGLYDKVCLCCVNAPLTAFEPTQVLKDKLGARAYQLCVRCLASETGRYLKREIAKVAPSMWRTKP